MKSLIILTVDNEEDMSKMFNKWMSEDRYHVKSVLTGSLSMRLVVKDPYDIVFLDFIKPGIPVDEILDQINEISSNTKVVLIAKKSINKNLLKELKQREVTTSLQNQFTKEKIKETLGLI